MRRSSASELRSASSRASALCGSSASRRPPSCAAWSSRPSVSGSGASRSASSCTVSSQANVGARRSGFGWRSGGGGGRSLRSDGGSSARSPADGRIVELLAGVTSAMPGANSEKRGLLDGRLVDCGATGAARREDDAADDDACAEAAAGRPKPRAPEDGTSNESSSARLRSASTSVPSSSSSGLFVRKGESMAVCVGGRAGSML